MLFFLQENYHVFLDLNKFAGKSPLLDAVMIFCANTLIFLWPILLILLWGRPLSWRKRPLRPGEAEIVQECRSIVLWIAAACLLAYGFNLGIEHVIFEPRPFVAHPHHVHLLIFHPADDSFPSDHSAWSFAVVGMLLFSFPFWLLSAWRKRLTFLNTGGIMSLFLPLVLMGIAVVMACSIGIARIFVGVHYPGDIVGGAVSGLLAAGIVTLLRHWLEKPTHAVLQLAQRFRLA
jgi:undecaprenyl-diphosphatase